LHAVDPGGKYGDFEGGVRSAAFLSGGFLLPQLRGTLHKKYVHVADWYVSFLGLAGVPNKPSDLLDDPAVPAIDSLDIWSSIANKSTPSPRRTIPLSSAHGPPGWGQMSETGPCIQPGVLTPSEFHGKSARCSQGAIIVDNYKLYFGPYGTDGADWGCEYCWWTPKRFAVTSSNRFNTSAVTPFNCPVGGCLWDIIADPQERNELSARFPEKVKALTAEFAAVQKTVWWSPGGAMLQPKSKEWQSELCAVVKRQGNFVGPYNSSGDMPHSRGGTGTAAANADTVRDTKTITPELEAAMKSYDAIQPITPTGTKQRRVSQKLMPMI
jgi:hypothetical protein